MELIPRQPHIPDGHGFIQPSQDTDNLVGVRGGYFPAIIVLEELRQPFVPEAFNHLTIMPALFLPVKHGFTLWHNAKTVLSSDVRMD